MKKAISCLLGIFLFSACEYPLHDNFVELDEPAKEIGMYVALSIENDGEMIAIWEDATNVSFNLTTSGPTPAGCIFRLGDSSWEHPSANGSFTIYKNNLSEKDSVLTCEMYAYTGTGSIAEQAGEEAYMGTCRWPVKIAGHSGGVRHTINADGYLEINWDKFALDAARFDGYVITSYFTDTVADVNRLSYVCPFYVGQGMTVQVAAKVKGKTESLKIGEVFLPALNPVYTCDYSRTDSIRMTWEHPYRAVIEVDDFGRNRQITGMPGERICFPYGLFGSQPSRMGVRILPFDPADRKKWPGLSTYYDMETSPGVRFDNSVFFPRVGYNAAENMLYVNSFYAVTGWSLPGIESYRAYQRTDITTINTFACSQGSSQVATVSPQLIELFDGKNLRLVQTITLDYLRSFIETPTLTNDGKLVVLIQDMENYEMVFAVYNAATGEPEVQFPLPSGYEYADKFNVTPDGRYLLINRYGKMDVMTLTNYRITAVRQLDTTGSFLCVNPSNADEFYLSFWDRVGLYNFNSRSLVKSWEMPGMRIGNVDPKTGYQLWCGDTSITVFDPKAGKNLYTMPVAGSWNYLYGNVLVSDTGYALPLDKELRK